MATIPGHHQVLARYALQHRGRDVHQQHQVQLALLAKHLGKGAASLREVTFQSIIRTSSPALYSRTSFELHALAAIYAALAARQQAADQLPGEQLQVLRLARERTVDHAVDRCRFRGSVTPAAAAGYAFRGPPRGPSRAPITSSVVRRSDSAS